MNDIFVKFLNRFSQGPLDRPPSPESFPQCFAVDLQNTRPIGDSVDFTAKVNVSISSRVIGLADTIRPTTILGRIISVVINSFQLKSRTVRWSHIGQEITERQPSLANGNASAAIPGKNPVFSIVTALFHRGPHLIQRSVAKMMDSICLDNYFSPQTSTTLTVSASQGRSRNFGLITTGTVTQPVVSDVFGPVDSPDGCFADNHPSSELFSSKVKSWLATSFVACYFGFVHGQLPFNWRCKEAANGYNRSWPRFFVAHEDSKCKEFSTERT